MTEEIGLRLTLAGRREAARGLAEVKGGLTDVADAGQQVEAAGRAAERGLERATGRRFARGFAAIARGGMGITRTVGRGLVGASRAGATGLGILSVAAGAAGARAISLAGDARETASAFDTVFGPSAVRVGRDIDQLTDRFGLYAPELQDAARQFGVFGKAAGMARKELPGFSTDLVKAGLDLGSFYNVSSSEAFQSIQSGLSGEAEPLRRFGIFLSDAAMKAEAATMGLTGELTEQQKVMVRHRLILKGLGDAEGDLERTSRGFANQQREASNRAKTFLTMIGGPLTTAATGAFRGFNAFAKAGVRELRRSLPGLEKDAAGLSRTFARWGRQAGRELPGAINTVSGALDRVDDVIGRIQSSGDGGGLGTLQANLTEMGPAVGALTAELPGLADLLTVTNTVTGFLADHTDLLADAMPYLAAGYVAVKVGQLAANVALAASLPMKIIELRVNSQLTKSNAALVASRGLATASTATETVAIGANTAAQNTGIIARSRALVGMIAHRAAAAAGAIATGVMAAAQWGLNAAMTANPIGLVVVAIAALAAGLVFAYKKSDTFRGIVNGLWNNVLKPFGKFLGGVLVGYIRLVATAWLTMGRFGIKAFSWLLQAAFKTFDGILSAAEAGMGWVPGIGDKIKGARRAFNEFGDATISKLGQLENKLRGVQERVNDLGRDRSSTITITTVYNELNRTKNSTATGLGPQPAGEGGSSRPAPSGRRSAGRAVQRSSIPLPPDVSDDALTVSEKSVGDLLLAGAPAPQHIHLNMDGREVTSVVIDNLRKRGARQ